MEIVALSNTGEKRKTNQDRIFASRDEDFPLFLVADGMGGHKAGEVASQMAETIVVDKLWKNKENLKNPIDIRKEIKTAIEEANTKIYLKSREKEEYEGMGTTITLGYLSEDIICIGHVGDSRAYLIGEDGISQITEDHSYVNQLLKTGTITEEEARKHPKKNIITRAVGTSSILEVELKDKMFKKGDIFLLTSDGLTNMISDEEILDSFRKEEELGEICEKLVEKANYNGGIDNISIVAVKINKEVKA